MYILLKKDLVFLQIRCLFIKSSITGYLLGNKFNHLLNTVFLIHQSNRLVTHT